MRSFTSAVSLSAIILFLVAAMTTPPVLADPPSPPKCDPKLLSAAEFLSHQASDLLELARKTFAARNGYENESLVALAELDKAADALFQDLPERPRPEIAEDFNDVHDAYKATQKFAGRILVTPELQDAMDALKASLHGVARRLSLPASADPQSNKPPEILYWAGKLEDAAIEQVNYLDFLERRNQISAPPEEAKDVRERLVDLVAVTGELRHAVRRRDRFAIANDLRRFASVHAAAQECSNKLGGVLASRLTAFNDLFRHFNERGDDLGLKP